MRWFKWFLLIFFILPCSAAAHPHLFVENSVKVRFDAAGMTGIAVEWTFDEMFSSTMIETYDSNKDGNFSSAETEALRRKAFSNLKGYHYFTFIMIADKPFNVQYIRDFEARIKDHKIIYAFFVPCHVKATVRERKVTIAIYDETYYTDILLVSSQCDHTPAPKAVTSTILKFENFDKNYYFGQIAPVEIIVNFRKASP